MKMPEATEPNKLTPARVRGVFRNLHAKTGSPAGAPKPSRPAQAGRQARRTSYRPPVTTSGGSSPPARHSAVPPTIKSAPGPTAGPEAPPA